MSDSPEVLAFRVGELEKNVTGLRNDLKELGGTLGGGMTALQTQLSNYQTNLNERHPTRREFDELRKRMEDQETRQADVWWKVVSNLVALTAIIVALLAWLHPFGH